MRCEILIAGHQDKGRNGRTIKNSFNNIHQHVQVNGTLYDGTLHNGIITVARIARVDGGFGAARIANSTPTPA